MSVFSKPVPRKADRDEPPAIKPWHQAPIPLVSELKKHSEDEEHATVKVKIFSDPNVVTSAKNEKCFKLFDSTNVEAHCQFRVDLDECIIQGCLDASNKKKTGALMITTSAAKDNFQLCVDGSPETRQDEDGDDIAMPEDEQWDRVLRDFAAMHCHETAKQEQRRFVLRRLGKPSQWSVTQLWTRLRVMQKRMQHLPGTGSIPDNKALREILVSAVPRQMEEIMIASDHEWCDPSKSDAEVVSYLQRLWVVHNSGRKNMGKKNEKAKPHKKGGNNAKKKDDRFCNCCKKPGHTIEVCRKKKRDKANKKSGGGNEEGHFVMEAEEADFSDPKELTAAMENGEFAIDHRESDDASFRMEALFNMTTRNPAFTNHTSPSDLTSEATIRSRDPTTDEHTVLKRCLIDAGASKTTIKRTALPDYFFGTHERSKETAWLTNGGKFTTKHECDLEFAIQEFTRSREIMWTCAVDETDHSTRCNVIIGRDLQQASGMDILWSSGQLAWDGMLAPMRSATLAKHHAELEEATAENTSLASDMEADEDLFEAQQILDADCRKADISRVVDDCNHLNQAEKKKLKAPLCKHEQLFDGTLGTWNTAPVNIELKPGSTGFQQKPFAVPQTHCQTPRKEVQRLVSLGVLEETDGSEFSSASFIVPKSHGAVRFVSDFRLLNQRVERKPCPIPKIQELLQSLAGFTLASSLDLNMGCCAIRLTPSAQTKCTVVFPWGQHEHKRLPQGLNNSPDIFQCKIDNLVCGSEFVRACLDDCLCIAKGSFDDHLVSLEQVLQRLDKAGSRCNMKKCFFASTSPKHLGCLVAANGIRPLSDKVEAMQRLKPPGTLRQVRSFLGMVNHCRDMWKRLSHLLTPLTALTKGTRKGSNKSKNRPIVWTKECDAAFAAIKQALTKETLLAFPDWDKTFDVHTDASKCQLGGVISQDGGPMAFHSRKLNAAQCNHATGEKEMSSVVEMLKEHRSMLLEHRIRVCTDHKNLTRANTAHQSRRLQRWRWVIEEHGPEPEHVQGPRNEVADALSRLKADFNRAEPAESDELHFAESLFDLDEMDSKSLKDSFPLSTRRVAEEQKKCETPKRNMERYPQHFSKTMHGHEVVTFHKKTCIPKSLRAEVLAWHHDNLRHPGSVRTERTMRQHLTWPGSRTDVEARISSCHKCQLCENPRLKHGKLSPKDHYDDPWDTICVDLVGPHAVTTKDGKDLVLKAMTMCDPAAGWFEAAETPDKKSVTTAILLDRVWFSRHPRPKSCICDNGNEFLGAEFQEMLESHGVDGVPTTAKNPQANHAERVHQTLGNVIRTCKAEERDWDHDDPWTGILTACAWATRSTMHTLLDATPAQLVFGRDMLFDLSFKTKWQEVKERRMQANQTNVAKENQKRKEHAYQIGDKVLVSKDTTARKLSPKCTGPHEVVRIYSN